MAKIHEHVGDQIVVTYEAKRCIHAGKCVHGLPAVFDIKRQPWIDPNAADPGAIAEVVARCPTGALRYRRLDGGPVESVPARNTVTVGARGPLYLRGRLEIVNADGAVALNDTRMALCRCGASKNKPFCDGSHGKAGFQDAGGLGQNAAKTVPMENATGALQITALANGPLAVKGEVTVHSADGQIQYQANQLYLCRCGASNNKPFCDGSHKRIGFSDAPPET